MKSILAVVLTLLSFSVQALELDQIKPKKNLKIGVYIGTFDPPHIGHQRVAQEAAKQGLVDYVVFIANDRAFHKPNATPFLIRHQMTRAIFAKDPKVIAPKLFKSNNALIQDVVAYIRHHYPQATLHGMLGTDIASISGEIYDHEKYWMDLLDGFIVNKRGGYDAASIPAIVAGKPVRTFEANDGGWSSTKIREMVKSGAGDVPLAPQVLNIVKELGLWLSVKECSALF